MMFDVKKAREWAVNYHEYPEVSEHGLWGACDRIETLEKENAALRAEVDLDRVAKLLADNVLLGEVAAAARHLRRNYQRRINDLRAWCALTEAFLSLDGGVGGDAKDEDGGYEDRDPLTNAVKGDLP